jgi:TRAP-type C4-dicarboxylate transport system substrate-binding protein
MQAGVKFNDVADKAAFQNAMKPVYEKFLASNPDLKPLVETIQATE